ncbi:MAG: hypothetical protein ACR2KK_18590 [Acidimicrobiales bacterium]
MAAEPDLDRPWMLCDPRRDRTMHPYTDADTARALDRAIRALVMLRAPMWVGDPGPTVSALVSLVAEADSRLADAVADAAEAGYSWDQIASRLASNAASAHRRYAGYRRWRAALALKTGGERQPPGDRR